MELFLRIQNTGYEKVPFGYEKKTYFHTLKKNIRCFFLMRDDEPRPVWMSLLITH